MWKKPIALAAILMLAACAASTVPASDGCLIFGPIHGDPTRVPKDVQDQIDDHNKAGVEVCGW